jgi:hypothetical protein
MKHLWLDFHENVLFAQKFPFLSTFLFNENFREIFVRILPKRNFCQIPQNFRKFRELFIFAKIGKGIVVSIPGGTQRTVHTDVLNVLFVNINFLFVTKEACVEIWKKPDIE